MKTKKLLKLLLASVIFISLFTVNAMAADNIKVILNGSELVFDVAPQLVNGKTMVPMRKIFEALGAEVNWISETQTITAEKENIVIIMQIGSPVISVNGNDIELDTAPFLAEGKTFVPLRAAAEGLSADVKWDSETRTVTISAEAKAAADYILSKQFSLIDDRLFINMPEDSIDSAKQPSRTNVFFSSQLETCLSLNRATERLYVYAYELFAVSSGDIEKDALAVIRTIDGKPDITFEYSDISKDGFEAAKIIPSSFDTTEKEVLLKSTLVKTEDNLLIMVSVYSESKYFNDEEKCIKLADDILDTLSLGSRTVNRLKRTEALWIYEMEIQEDYTTSLFRGVDFDVHHIMKTIGADDMNRPTMGIYMGWHPSPIKAPQDSKVEITAGKILNQDMEWVSYEHNGIFHHETIFSVPTNDYPMLHIFISADNEKDLGTLKAMAHTLILP